MFVLSTVLDGKDSEDSSSGPLALPVTEDSSEATNDSSVVINSEETSREPATNGNGNGNDNTNDDTPSTTEDASVPLPPQEPEAATEAAPTNGGSEAVLPSAAEGDNAVDPDGDELEPSSKKIRLQEEPPAEEGTA